MSPTPSSDRRQGAVLLVVIVFTVAVSLLVASTVDFTLTESRSVTSDLDRAEALALAEGVTESVQKDMLDSIANFETFPMSGTVTLGGVDYPYTVQLIGSEINRTDSDGVNLAIQPYLINSQVDIQLATANVSRVADLTMTPIFQYMIFYSDDLEILPGPNMTLGGRVHSNANIYMGSGATLTVDTDYLRCTGELYRQRKNDGSATGGTIDIKEFEQTTFQAMSPTMDSTDPDWVNLALDTWGGTVQTGAHGVSEVVAPEIGSIKAFNSDGSKGHYHANADLVFIDGQAFDSGGNPIGLPPGVVQEVTMFDGRENKNVTVTEIDIDALNASGHFPANGLIYAYRTDASASQPNGIRLTNGQELAAPLTVVTEDPIYVHGDFNTVNKKGAAVMADAVNLLSNAWDDSKTAGSLPTASDTWFNLAIVTGNVPTPDGGGAYSGGFENLPRFHESWSGRTCSIRGSFIKTYDSEFAVSPWSYGGQVYTAPVRDWLYDPDLTDLSNLPPFTPNAVYFRRVTWDDNVAVPFSP
ncbi:MAG: pilus assembly PilX N-terminal domain-containing protein [Planctomycetes bacterium]|nr:pilus assembly PilX N-terminal domain-containing protein [Planctomycetota bacterium]